MSDVRETIARAVESVGEGCQSGAVYVKPAEAADAAVAALRARRSETHDQAVRWIIARALYCDGRKEFESTWNVECQEARQYFFDLADVVLAALSSSGKEVLGREPDWRMCEAGEDLVSDAVESGRAFGVRCGCEDCDKQAWEDVAKIWRAMWDAAHPTDAAK